MDHVLNHLFCNEFLVLEFPFVAVAASNLCTSLVVVAGKKKKKPWHFEGESEGFRQRWARPLLGPTFRKARRGEREE